MKKSRQNVLPAFSERYAMKKILIIGCPGGGKSTFARALQQKTALPLFYLDMLYWNEDRTHASREVFLDRLNCILQQPSWIMDGNYLGTMAYRMDACDTIIFLDYPTDICLVGIHERFGKSREDMPWIETEEDPQFLAFIQAFQTDTKPKILSLLAKHGDKKIYIFHSRQEADDFLRT